MSNLPLLKVPRPKSINRGIFIKKLEQCCAHIHGCLLFEDIVTDPLSDLNYKDVKTATLREILEYISTNIGVVTGDMYPDIFHLFTCNVFRTLPPSSTPKTKRHKKTRKGKDEVELRNLEKTIYDLEETMDDLKEELDELKQDINYLGNQDIENLEEEMEYLEENLDNLKQEMDYLEEGMLLDKSDCPHLYLVYAIFLEFLDLPDLEIDIAINHIGQQFLLQLLELFNSEDPHERVFVMKTLHLIYGMFIDLRIYISKEINNIIFRCIYENEEHNGIAELLQISGSIIEGFDVPLNEEHKVFLLKVLMPLHQKSFNASIHTKLVDCVKQFIIKQPSLIESVVNSLLRYWPKQNCFKELFFMQESVHILNDIQSAELSKVVIPLFKRYAKCISSAHLQVAHYGLECTLIFLNNEDIIDVINDNATALLPIFISAIKDSKSHWKNDFQLFADDVLEAFKKVNTDVYEECVQNYEHIKQCERDKIEEREKKWDKIETLAINNLALKGTAPLKEPSGSAERSISRRNRSPMRKTFFSYVFNNRD